ncbi:hypothetical protein [Streptomyces sp. NPDC051132]|uniref:hypothetical protein n=1 Tax=unclassified Streptomyces TaxID=2593676 RepID=UPI00342B3722
MASDMDDRSQDHDHRELRLAVLVLALVVGLLITVAATYLAREHPSLAQPLGVGATVMSALCAITGVIARVMRR